MKRFQHSRPSKFIESPFTQSAKVDGKPESQLRVSQTEETDTYRDILSPSFSQWQNPISKMHLFKQATGDRTATTNFKDIIFFL